MAVGAKIGHDVRSIYEYRNEAHKCIRCGMCRMVNPDYLESHKYSINCVRGSKYMFESFFGTGTHEIVRSLTHDPQELEIDDRMLEIIYTCTICGSCQSICNPIKELEPANAMMALREYLNDKGHILKEHNTLIQSIINYDNPWLAPRRNRARWARELNKKTGIEIKDASKEKVEVLCFAGCNGSYVDQITPVSRAMARVLDIGGVNWGILGEKERCCGSTAFRTGAVGWFEDYKRKNIEQLNSLGIKTLITVCAGCYSTFKHNYEGELNFEIVHLSEYLDRMIKDGTLKFKKELDMRVTYHDPCHLGRYGGEEDGIYDQHREILKALPGVEFREMERIRYHSMCCGSGGGVKTAFPDLAVWNAQRRWEEAKDVAGADIMTSCCPFCEINLGDAANNIPGAKMYDVMQLVDLALGE